MRGRSRSAAVVADLDDDLPGDMRGRDADDARRGLAGRNAFGGRFEAVVGAIADEMRQRIADDVDQLAVEFRFAALDDERDLLAEIAREIARQTRQCRENADRAAACARA